ncbi:MAG: hypothetical protein C0393_02590, partial [Anaerolinea sp.]|nr:hypothetical protein [Anaerolinea sp.]
YRIVQEALTNAAHHAEARSVSVLVERRGAAVVAVIEDDGKGFANVGERGAKQLGLLGMRERAELLGGCLTIESGKGKGTSVFVEIPLKTDSPSFPFPARTSDELPHPHPARR